MTGPVNWKLLWERRDMGDREREASNRDDPPTFAARLMALRQRLPIIGAALAVVFIVFGIMRAILSLFGTNVANAPFSLQLCATQSVGESVASDLVQAFLVRQGVTSIDISRDDKSGDLHLTTHLPGSTAATMVSIMIADSGGSFDRLFHRACNVAIVSREINPIESSRFASSPTANLIALDGAVFVVHPANPIHALTMNEIRAIFAGEMTNWASLGVKNRRIMVSVPERGSDEVSLVSNRLLSGQVPLARFLHSATIALDVSGPRTLGAIGITSFHASDPARFVRIIDGAGHQYTPSTLSIGRRTYPLTLPVYAYRDESYMSSAAYQFLTFLDSTEGQDILVDDGFVSPFAF